MTVRMDYVTQRRPGAVASTLRSNENAKQKNV